MEGIFKWIRKFYNKFIHSIGFLPALFGLVFLLISVATMEMDDAGMGTALNKRYKWLTLEDAETARTVVSTVATGIISLTVFSFSMVMILMNQAASQMSNRMLDNIIGDKVQKTILGFYIGTIIYSLFLLINIGGNNNNVPTLSVYTLLLFTIVDIFLFVYFLHHITQSLRYEQLIKRIHLRAVATLQKLARNEKSAPGSNPEFEGQEILSVQSGYYQGFDENQLLKFATEQDVVIKFLYPIGTYILKGTPLLIIKGALDEHMLKKMLLDIDFYSGQEIDKNTYYGFYHLTEVAVKALSPGINDFGTAVLSINALTDLFAKIIASPIEAEIKDDKGGTRIITKQLSVEELYTCAVLPIWDYGRRDRMVQHALSRMLIQLIFVDKEGSYKDFFERHLNDVETKSM